MASQPCTPAPPPPPNAPSDWGEAVRGNCFSNIQRLGQWNAANNNPIPSGTDPSANFLSVSPGSIGGGANPPPVYVLAHGWAPGYLDAVTAAGGNLLWWSAGASANGVWASDWAWGPVTVPQSNIVPANFSVNTTGLLQSIAALDPGATVLAYSWIDDSATDSGNVNLTEVYQSEAYTFINGLRLADALEQAISSSFWGTGALRLIGHSHGSKVATVAALILQQKGYAVAHLTILDAPENDFTLHANGSNLLGFYLEQMQIATPPASAGGLFVDNYASCFGVTYAGASNLQNIVQVDLNPDLLYPLALAEQHSYSAAWYGGAASQSTTPLGLGWPPPPASYTPALNQTWPGGISEAAQWKLQTGPADNFSYTTATLEVTEVATSGNVTVGSNPMTLGFGPNNGGYSVFQGQYSVSTHDYGIAFDLAWTDPQAGDYLVVCVDSPGQDVPEVVLVLDGQSNPSGPTSVAINSFHPFDETYAIYIYFVTASGSNSQVSLSNFQSVLVDAASGYLQARRLALAEARRRQLALAAPGPLISAPAGVTLLDRKRRTNR